jgi:hypothetical protein
MALKRRQIYLDEDSDRKIRRLSRSTGLSEAEHIRRAIASYISQVAEVAEPANPLLRLVGICDGPKGPKDAAVHHDKYLYRKKL